jgi:RNA polymerase sigma factor (sigma-70 family)
MSMEQQWSPIPEDDEHPYLEVVSDSTESDLEPIDVIETYIRGSTLTPDTYRDYHNNINRIPLLKTEEEISLSKTIQAGIKAHEHLDAHLSLSEHPIQRRVADELEHLVASGKEALDRLVMANLRLVVANAKTRKARGVSLVDLIQEGNIGLIAAAELYDHTKGKFSTFARYYIDKAIYIAVREQGRSIRLPEDKFAAMRALKRAEATIEQRLRRRPNPNDLAQELGIPIKDVVELIEISSPIESIEELLEAGWEPRAAAEAAVTDSEPSTDPRTEQLLPALASLSERDKEIVSKKFGLGGDQALDYVELSKSYGLAPQTIRNIVSGSIKRIRAFME